MSEKQTPGNFLRAARLSHNLEQSDVAERLRLSVQTIIDIENDDYKHFSAEIYLRGHMRSYARLVSADTAELFRVYEEMGIEIEADPQVPVLLAQDAADSNRARRSKRKMILWAGLSVFLILIVMIMLWWQEQRHNSDTAQLTSLGKSTVTLSSQEVADLMSKKTAQKRSIF